MSLFNQGLLITAIGMGLVFVMIFALWGIMALLVKLTNKPEAEVEAEEVVEAAPVSEAVPAQDPNAALAAAIAVAWALADQASAYAFKPSQQSHSENAWLNVGRTQQLYTSTFRGRNR